VGLAALVGIEPWGPHEFANLVQNHLEWARHNMSKYTLYGPERSRAGRVSWMFRELGLPFMHIEGAPPLEINPNGKVSEGY
jgi:hypothetical protein